jgi:hypothetical protein
MAVRRHFRHLILEIRMFFRHRKVVTATTRLYLQLAGMCSCLPALRLQTDPVGTKSNPFTIHRIWSVEGGVGKPVDDTVTS